MTGRGTDHDLFSYSPIITRRGFRWPGDARLALAVVVSIETYELAPPPGSFMPPNLPGGLGRAPYPDVRTVSHREYGLRIGAFRVLDILKMHGIPATAAIDALTARRSPAIMTETYQRGLCVIGHGQAVTQVVSEEMSRERERDYIRSAVATLEASTRSPVIGWHGPEYGQSSRTPELLAAAGLKYVLDWPNDEQPYMMQTPSGPLLSIPLSIDLDDVFAHWHRKISMGRWVRSVCDALDRLEREASGTSGGRMLVLNLHPWLIGQPWRSTYLDELMQSIRSRPRIWLTTTDEIADWAARQLDGGADVCTGSNQSASPRRAPQHGAHSIYTAYRPWNTGSSPGAPCGRLRESAAVRSHTPSRPSFEEGLAMEHPVKNAMPARTVFVNEFTDGLLDPARPMLGPVADGGTIVANTAPGCWGPMITPSIRGGHEVTRPVYVEGAEVGDAIVIRIKSINVASRATSSGNDALVEGRFNGDPYCAAKCSSCGTEWPETRIEGIGPRSVHCANCGNDATPFVFANGYTIVFDESKSVGVTIGRSGAEEIARRATHYAALPENSAQNPILLFAPSDLVGVSSRLRPFLGQLGTCPSATMPDSHNAGDFGAFLVGAPHKYAMSEQDLARHKTDGHLDIAAVREGSIIVCPVKITGAGVYLGDMHALQGDGEIAGHTCDVAGHVVLQVNVIKGLPLDGPVLFPRPEDLPFLARGIQGQDRTIAESIASSYRVKLEDNLPISVIGTGKDLNTAIDNGLSRAAALFQMSVPEVKNRATILGAIELGRSPGVVRVTFRAPVSALENAGLRTLAEEMYGEM